MLSIKNDHPLLRYLDETEIRMLESVCHKETFEPNTELIHTNQRNRDIICLEEGTVSIQIESLDGTVRELTQIHACNMIGEMNFVIPTRRTANVVAVTHIKASIYPYQELTRLLAEHDIIACKIFAAINLSLMEKYVAMQ